ncbi:MAG: hypothetical protein Q4F63_01310 [Clostridia bacterium]|nr:hypothetical protein [Clostridia bacterium]
MSKKLCFRFKTPKDIRNSIARINNMVANGEMDTKTANSIICGCNTLLGSIKADEQQKQIDELRTVLDELESGK